ncbi:MAG: glycosyltransferase, partial [Cyanobacteria bacterium J06631_2]
VASKTFEALVTNYRLEFYPLPGDISAIAKDPKLRGAMEADNPLKVVFNFMKMKNYARSLQQEFQQEYYAACKDSEAIIYHPGAAIGYFIAQAMNIPGILATPFPMTPTKEYPSLIFYNSFNSSKTLNLLTHKLFEQILWQMSKSAIEQFWSKKFGSLPPHFSNPFSQQQKIVLTLVACSNYVFPQPYDWAETVHNTGYWFLDEGNDWSPSNELQQFLQAGKPPIYVGFGSLGNPSKTIETTELVINAISRSGQRGILATGWSGMKKLDKISQNILIIESIPHAWLFPKMSVVVHHGGAGTTAAGLRAGVPSVIIPHSNDQFAWGKRVYELGVGAKPVPRKQLTAEKLSTSISFALKEDVKARAKALGAKIQQERGVEVAAKLIANRLIQPDL